MWQELYLELADTGLVVITVALDRHVDDVLPYVEEARPTHPSLIDVEHTVAALYGMINVPTVVWIDEHGRIVRPNDVAFGSDMFKDFHGMESEPHKRALRAWVKDGASPLSEAEVRARQMMPTAAEQQARAEFALARLLHERGASEAAERHFVRAGELSPDDFTIRRGSMPIRGLDPMGEPFFALYQEWEARGRPYYRGRTADEAKSASASSAGDESPEHS